MVEYQRQVIALEMRLAIAKCVVLNRKTRCYPSLEYLKPKKELELTPPRSK